MSDVILGGMGKKSPTHNIVGRADKRGVRGRALTAAPEGQSKKAEASECSRSRFGNYGKLSVELDFGESVEIVVATVVAVDVEFDELCIEWSEATEVLTGVGV